MDIIHESFILCDITADISRADDKYSGDNTGITDESDDDLQADFGSFSDGSNLSSVSPCSLILCYSSSKSVFSPQSRPHFPVFVSFLYISCL